MISLPGRSHVRLLGGGGSAEVHLFREEHPPRDVAVKILRNSDPQALAALEQEAEAMAAVAEHPNVATFHGTGISDGTGWLAMEYCPGTDLAQRDRTGALPVGEALSTIIAVASGVAALHEAGYVHRDIKPANILHTRWGHPVLADFGAARPIGASTATAGFSPAWSPPEQHTGADAHPTQDVWALAATCWSLLVGRSPFEIVGGDNGDAAIMARTRAGAFSGIGRADVPDALETVLRAALALSPTQRTPTVTAFADQLRGIQDTLGLGAAEFAPSTVEAQPQEDPFSTRPASAPLVSAQGSSANETTIVPVPTDAAVAREAPPRRRPWLLLLAALLLILVTVAVTIGVLAGSGLRGNPGPVAPSSAAPLDPIDAPPSPIADATSEVIDGTLIWAWRPSADQGVRYQVTTTLDGGNPQSQQTTFTTHEVPAVAGEHCLSVVAISRNGRPSQPLERCVTVD